jgi:hypothetical protein
MPRKLQEAADSGATNFSFEDARIELEKLYAFASSAESTELQLKLEKFLNNYNGYISILNDAISGKVTLDEVNEFYDKKIIKEFKHKIRLNSDL